jgi:hypothetical protein
MSDKEKLHELVKYLKDLALELGRTPTSYEFIDKYGNSNALRRIKFSKLIDAAGLKHHKFSHFKSSKKPKILLLDIETAPSLGFIWGLFDQNVGLNQLKEEWHLLSFACKWLGEKEVFYIDGRNEEELSNDLKICKFAHKFLDEADIVIGHNSKRFDVKKLNARFIINKLKPPSPYRQIDTLNIAKSKFSFTSNKLEYLASKLTKKKKMTKRKFEGFSLWMEFLKRNKLAYKEMELYNKQDVIVLEEVYNKLIAWDKSINFSAFQDGVNICQCGSDDFKENGYNVTNQGKFIRYKCSNCGANFQNKKNMISMKESLRPV